MVHKMADFDFYCNTYLGSRIPEQEFPKLAAKAAGVLGSYDRVYQVTGGETERAMAVCAMAECLHIYGNHRSAASVGQVSVHYEKPRLTLEQALLKAARIYLDIYRGVG